MRVLPELRFGDSRLCSLRVHESSAPVRQSDRQKVWECESEARDSVNSWSIVMWMTAAAVEVRLCVSHRGAEASPNPPERHRCPKINSCGGNSAEVLRKTTRPLTKQHSIAVQITAAATAKRLETTSQLIVIQSSRHMSCHYIIRDLC